MFNFLNTTNNYDERKVKRYELGNIIIDTCKVTDGKQPYETGISHPLYNNGEFVIVQSYDTTDEAILGHDNWIEVMTSVNLPLYLRDCGNSFVSQLGDACFGDDFMRFPKQK